MRTEPLALSSGGVSGAGRRMRSARTETPIQAASAQAQHLPSLPQVHPKPERVKEETANKEGGPFPFLLSLPPPTQAPDLWGREHEWRVQSQTATGGGRGGGRWESMPWMPGTLALILSLPEHSGRS